MNAQQSKLATAKLLLQRACQLLSEANFETELTPLIDLLPGFSEPFEKIPENQESHLSYELMEVATHFMNHAYEVLSKDYAASIANGINPHEIHSLDQDLADYDPHEIPVELAYKSVMNTIEENL